MKFVNAFNLGFWAMVALSAAAPIASAGAAAREAVVQSDLKRGERTEPMSIHDAYAGREAKLAGPMRIHVMQNLSAAESAEMNRELLKLGYQPTENSIFSESKNAIIVTKALKNEHEDASITVELVQLSDEKEIPRTLFQYSLKGNDVQEMMKVLPKPEAFIESSSMSSVAALDPR